MFAACMWVGRVGMLAMFCFASFLGFKEFLSLIALQVDQNVLLWAYLAIPVQYYFVGVMWYGMFIVFIPVYMLLLLAARTVLTGVTAGFLKTVGTLQWGKSNIYPYVLELICFFCRFNDHCVQY